MTHVCPRCSSPAREVVLATGVAAVMRALGLCSVRCKSCRRVWRSSLWTGGLWSKTHCSRCYSEDLGRWNPANYQAGLATSLMAMMGATPYRCGKCGYNCASFLPAGPRPRLQVAKLALALAFLAAVSSPAQGAISACSGATLATLAAAGGNTPSGGCGTVDLAFSGFSLSSGSVGLGAITLGNMTGGSISGSGESQAITPIVATFASTSWVSPLNGNSQNVVYSVFSTHLQVVPGESAPTAPFVSWGIRELALALPQMAATTPAGYVQVQTEFCLGAASFNCTSTAANYGYIMQRVTYNGSANVILNTICTPGAGGCTTGTNALASASFNFGAYYLDIGIRNSITISHPSTANGTVIQLSNFAMTANQLAETPEPSTFGMLGMALLGVGISARRRKR